MSTRPESTPATPTGWARLRRLLPHAKKARGHFIAGILAGVVFAAASGVGLPMMLYLVAPVIFGKTPPPSEQLQTAATNVPVSIVVTGSTNSAATIATGKKTDAKLQSADDKVRQTQEKIARWARRFFGDDYQNGLLLISCLGLPLIFLVRGVSAFFNRYWINHAGFTMLESLRTDVFHRLQQLPLAYHQRHQSGDLTSRLMNDTDHLKNVVVQLSADIIKQPFTLIGALGTLIYHAITHQSAVFVLVTLVSVPLCVAPIRLVAQRIVKKSRRLASETGELTAVVTESLQATMEIQAFNLQPRLQQRFIASVRNILRLAMKTVKYQSFTNPVVEFISACGFMVALYVGARRGMSFEIFSSMGLALYMAYEPIKKFSAMSALIKMGSASLERLEEVLDAEDTVPQPAQPVALPTDRTDIALENVGFTYQPRSTDDVPSPALIDINVRFKPGEVVALVGESGAGKSTFVALLPRFYDVTSGRVTVGGVDVRTADKTALRDRIALVPQMPTLFNGSIADNIRVGRANATDGEVKAAAQKAFIADFIEGLPQGYETPVGERGASLSGGQRQRIAIARAFLKDAPVLILDEATSALDSESESKIQMALKQLVGGRTTFMIAHRFSSIGLATRILVFEKGRITGDGTPAELAKTHPVYRRMCELQKL